MSFFSIKLTCPILPTQESYIRWKDVHITAICHIILFCTMLLLPHIYAVEP